MKALHTSAPGEFGLVERPMPKITEFEALVKVGAAAICHTDVLIRHGLTNVVGYPVIVGHEFSGVVEACGPMVTRVKPGDHVAIDSIVSCGQCRNCRLGWTVGCEDRVGIGSGRDGGFAEYAAIPENNLYPVADHLTLEEAAMVEPAGNAYSAVRQARIRHGDRVVIIGPGPIGLLALQFARLYHPLVLLLVGTRDERLAVGAKLGATHTVNIRQENAEEDILSILGGEGADAVVECAGTRSAVELALKLAGMNSRVAFEGVMGVGETMEFVPLDVVQKGMSIIGVLGYLTPDFVYSLELLERGLIDVQPIITHRFSLDEWEHAFYMIEKRKSEAIKVEFTTFA